jgi:ribose 5-phosphate isomerase B
MRRDFHLGGPRFFVHNWGMSKLIIPIASDHRGFAMKAKFITWLSEHGYTPLDLGTNSEDRCDAGDFSSKLAAEFKTGQAKYGVLICGTGQAMAMTANRYQHLRAALCTNTTVARLTREHNDANILVLGADVTGYGVAIECLEVFLKTKFLEGRYTERRDKLTALGGL